MSLKEYLNEDFVLDVSSRINTPEFNNIQFEKAAVKDLESKEFKDRVLHITTALKNELPANYPDALDILVASLGPKLTGTEGMFKDGYYALPFVRFIEEFGLDYPEESLAALEEMTQRHTAEFAVRPFVDSHYEITVDTMLRWAEHDNEHVRRAASECVRPKLPWALTLKRFVADPAPIVPVLDKLHRDPSKFVQKSVANNLNDISKTHPELALETAARWLDEGNENSEWVVNHGLRTMIKAGNRAAMKLVGVAGAENLKAEKFTVSPTKIAIGDELILSLKIKNTDTKPCQVIVDYIVFFKTKTGVGQKVFKWKKLELGAGETIELTKKHSFKVITTRTYYPGEHKIDLQVNGSILASADFELTV